MAQISSLHGLSGSYMRLFADSGEQRWCFRALLQSMSLQMQRGYSTYVNEDGSSYDLDDATSKWLVDARFVIEHPDTGRSGGFVADPAPVFALQDRLLSGTPDKDPARELALAVWMGDADAVWPLIDQIFSTRDRPS